MKDNTPNKPLALVTGASRGLGAAMALELSVSYHVLAVARTIGALEELDDRIRAKGGEATLAPLDLSGSGAIEGLAEAIISRWGKLDLLVHAAIHAPPLAPASMMAPKDWEKSISINAKITGDLIAHLGALIPETGHAIFFSDQPAIGKAYHGAYGATKALQIALAESWKQETARIGPSIQIAHPSPMPTALRARFHPGEDRTALTSPSDEANRIIKELNLMQSF